MLPRRSLSMLLKCVTWGRMNFMVKVREILSNTMTVKCYYPLGYPLWVFLIEEQIIIFMNFMGISVTLPRIYFFHLL